LKKSATPNWCVVSGVTRSEKRSCEIAVLIPDVNVMVQALRRDANDHEICLAWLDEALAGPKPVGIVESVIAGTVRVVTNPRIFAEPTAPRDAVTFVRAVLESPNSVAPPPSGRLIVKFLELCERVEAKGNIVPDAWLAATAIDLDATLVTADRGFARFPGLRWRHPLD
jgi:uncharacterized protein